MPSAPAVLNHFTQITALSANYLILPKDLEDRIFELPLQLNKAALTSMRLVYQELIFEVPAVLLCSADCQASMPHCGKKAAGCTCKPRSQETTRPYMPGLAY